MSERVLSLLQTVTAGARLDCDWVRLGGVAVAIPNLQHDLDIRTNVAGPLVSALLGLEGDLRKGHAIIG